MTYKQLFDQVKNDAKGGSRATVAQLLAVRQLMNANGPDTQVDQNAVTSLAMNFMTQRDGFRKVMDDPDSKELWESGNASELMHRIQDYELPSPTYWRTMQNLKREAQNGNEETAAEMLAVSIIMDKEDAHSLADPQRITRDSQKLRQQTAFKNLMKDPKATEVMKAGKHHELMIMLAEKQAEITEAEGEAEYMKLIREAYDTEEKEEFYSFLRGLDALEQSFTSGNSTIILNRDSELVKLLYGAGLTEQN